MHRLHRFVLVALCAVSTGAGAAPFLITNRTSDLNPSDPNQAAMLQAMNDAADAIQDTVNNGFLAPGPRQSFADDLAKANTSPTASFIADRATNFSRFSIGGGVQGNFYWQGDLTSSNANNQIPQLGAGAQGGLVLGLRGSIFGGKSLGPLDPKRLGIFLSAMGGSSTVSSVHASLFNVGLNFQYDLIEPKGIIILRWNGLKFLTGFNYATNEISYSGNIKQNTSTTVSGQTANIAVDVDYTIGARNRVFYVPLEVSTGLQVLYFVTVYGGAAADLNFGASSLIGTGNGPITATGSSSFGVANLFSGTATINLDDGTDGHPQTVTLRSFAGVQINLLALRLDFQASTMSNGTKGAAAMARIAL